MGAGPPHEFTLILGRARTGDEQARGELIALVYDELRRVASGLMRRERADHTLTPTAVVHEAVIRLLGGAVFDTAPDRSYLFASAARAMRRILVEHARRRATDRRGGGRRRVPLDRVVEAFEAKDLDVDATIEDVLLGTGRLQKVLSAKRTLRGFEECDQHRVFTLVSATGQPAGSTSRRVLRSSCQPENRKRPRPGSRIDGALPTSNRRRTARTWTILRQPQGQ